MSRKSLLIVEDDIDIRESLREVFEDQGYHVWCASNGREGLEALRHARPSVVLLDLIMPLMNGNEMYAEMQANPALASIPVIISTSDPSRAPSGVVVIRKPVEIGRLVSAIAALG